DTWDYIIVGSGAGGIPLADRLSESGKSVLLLERGWASSGRWGGPRPAWLNGSNLTRFDVPGLYNYIWSNHTENAGILCPDYSATASCVLGGGTAINAGLWYKPTKEDWDLHMPPGFQSRDVGAAVSRAFSRVPWTDIPSTDGRVYVQDGPNLVIGTLTNNSLARPYKLIQANDKPNAKDRIISHTEHFFLHGERGGPMATYLVSASRRRNFKLQMNTTVSRIIRNGGFMTGVAVESTSPGGYTGTINITPKTGRVILSAGVFGTSKILIRSGIGPIDQLYVVKNSPDGVNMPAKNDWINIRVGYNLDDSPAIYIAVTAPGVQTYDYESAYNNPILADAERYLRNRTGPLAQVEPSIGPSFWDTIKGGDNKTRVVQWNVNTGSLNGVPLIVLFAYLNLGKTSRGRLTLDSNLHMNVSTLPYFNDAGDNDFKTLLGSIKDVASILSNIPNSTFYLPPTGTNIDDYVRGVTTTSSALLTSNHWTGTTAMGSVCDSSVVVDTTTKVCGTQNLHIVDAGIINGVPSSNPQGMIVSVAERAAEIILGLD
ncbi:cellobiose dehydrogenase, partial [Lindgomyces ingoldianus]